MIKYYWFSLHYLHIFSKVEGMYVERMYELVSERLNKKRAIPLPYFRPVCLIYEWFHIRLMIFNASLLPKARHTNTSSPANKVYFSPTNQKHDSTSYASSSDHVL